MYALFGAVRIGLIGAFVAVPELGLYAAMSCGATATACQTACVITARAHMQVSCDGTVAFRTGERIMFSYLVSQRFVGDRIPLTVLRNGEELDLEVCCCLCCAAVPQSF